MHADALTLIKINKKFLLAQRKKDKKVGVDMKKSKLEQEKNISEKINIQILIQVHSSLNYVNI